MPLFWPLIWNVISISSLLVTWLKDANLNFWPLSLMGEGTCFQVEGPLGARSFSQVLSTSAWFFWGTQRFHWHTANLRDGWSGWFKLSLGGTVWLFVCWSCNERPAHPGCTFLSPAGKGGVFSIIRLCIEGWNSICICLPLPYPTFAIQTTAELEAGVQMHVHLPAWKNMKSQTFSPHCFCCKAENPAHLKLDIQTSKRARWT